MAKTTKKSTKKGNGYVRRADGTGAGSLLGQVEDNIPISSITMGNSTANKYPVEFKAIMALENKQSVSFPNTELGRRVIGAIKATAEKLTKKKFVIRKVDKDTCRIWRNDAKRTYKKEFTGNRFVDGEGKPKKDAPKGSWGPQSKKGKNSNKT